MQRIIIGLSAIIFLITGCSQTSYGNVESSYKADSKDSSIIYGKTQAYNGFQINGPSYIGICDPVGKCRIFPESDSGYFAIKMKTGFYLIKMMNLNQTPNAGATVIINDDYSALRFRIQHPGRWYYLGNITKSEEDKYIKVDFNKSETDERMKRRYKNFKSDSTDTIDIN
jgi:hypothetical protein